MRNLKVAARLGLGFGLVLLLSFVIVLLAIRSIHSLDENIDLVIENRFPKTVQANDIIDSVSAVSLMMSNSLLDGNLSLDDEFAKMESARLVIEESLKALDETITSREGINYMNALKQARADYVGGQARFLELVREGRRVEAETLLLSEITAFQQVYMNAVAKVIDYQTDLMREAGLEAQHNAQGAIWQLLLLSGLALLAGIGIAVWIVRSLMRQLGGEPEYAAAMVRAISQGDLSQSITVRPGDTVSLLASLEEMQQSLKKLVDEISTIVRAAAGQGDFGKRLDLSDKRGFGHEIAAGLNQLAETTETGLEDVTRVADALAAGDLSQTISRDYPGLFGRTTRGVNGTVTALTTVVSEIRGMVETASRGDFGTRIALEGKSGFDREIAVLLNQLADTTESGLQDVLRVAQALAEGDLTQTIAKDAPGLFGETNAGVNTTVVNLQRIVNEIKEAVDTVSTASKQIAVGNQDLSQRTEEQASSLQETASSMEELTSTVKQNADNARQANQMAVNASDLATQGGAVVEESVRTMTAISASSKQIADIIGVIDSIAFQTNILALNAAVEAARAGEQGRGFAVVAAEVRNLAQRSANAAKEINTLITDSVSKVDSGTKQVNEAGASMREILSAIKRVSDLIAEISAASDEQTSGIEQVNQAIMQMDDVTQQNASLVEESAAAAESLEEQAQSLARSVAVFRLDDAASAARPRADTGRSMALRPSMKSAAVAKKQALAIKRTPAAPRLAAVTPSQSAGTEDEWAEF